jgi:hypothetical protein
MTTSPNTLQNRSEKILNSNSILKASIFWFNVEKKRGVAARRIHAADPSSSASCIAGGMAGH